MQQRILWVDDEIDLLKPHIIFLEEKGYEMYTATNGDDALEMVAEQHFDLVFLDENMPGLSGLDTLNRLKLIRPNVPVVMVTKSEEEDIMDQAIGSKIADYLIKPVNPKQILLSLKKNLDKERIINERTTSVYQSEFGKIGMEINQCTSFDDWAKIYSKLVYWEMEFDQGLHTGMEEVFRMQKNEANIEFSKYIKRNYPDWFSSENADRPIISPNLMSEFVFPHMKNNEKVFFLVIDNLRYDQWKVIEPAVREHFVIDNENVYSSILPTATQYARNSIFAGLMPADIQKAYPEYWLNDEDEGGKNQFEAELLAKQMQRHGIGASYFYEKINHSKAGRKLVDEFDSLMQNDLVVLVYNFIDMLSHARTEMQMIRELADNESAYRSLTLSWFKHSPLLDMLKRLADEKVKVVITTDHGTIRVQKPIQVVGDRNTSTNLRYKTGKNLDYNPKEIFEIAKPAQIHLPQTNITSKYIFATNADFLAYPKKFNYYVSYYKNTFQHGGISMEEMIVPIVTLKSKQFL